MASGCIINTCHVCKELIWEDEEYFILADNNFVHSDCKGYLGKTLEELAIMLNMQKQEIESLRKDKKYLVIEIRELKERARKMIKEVQT